jgi:CRP-like cAMP-binding protein
MLHRLYIILEGKAEVCTGAGSYPVGDIREHQFVGALSFLNYLERASSSVKTDKSTPISNSSVNWVSSVDVRAAEPCVVLTWSFEQLAAIFKREPALANAFQGSISVDLKKKISHGWAGNTPPCERYRGMLQGALIDNELSVKEKEVKLDTTQQ